MKTGYSQKRTLHNHRRVYKWHRQNTARQRQRAYKHTPPKTFLLRRGDKPNIVFQPINEYRMDKIWVESVTTETYSKFHQWSNC